MLNELFELLSLSFNVDYFLVDISIIETCCGKDSDWAYDINSDDVSRFKWMKRDNFESILISSEEEEEDQE